MQKQGNIEQHRLYFETKKVKQIILSTIIGIIVDKEELIA